MVAERKGVAAPEDLLARRSGLMTAVEAGMWRTDPAPVEMRIEGVRCLRFSPVGPARGTVIHLHGGAFRIGCPEQIGPFAAALAARCQVDVIAPAYRLAPEHPFPAGLNDGWAVTRALARKNVGPMLLLGDSAGGGLAAGVAILAHGRGLAVAGLVLLSPWLDLTLSGASYAANAAFDPLFSFDAARAAAEQYLQGHPADDPLASPLYGPPEAFPPTCINVGSREVLYDDARSMHDRLGDAGRSALWQCIENMEHVAVTRDLTLPGSAETFAAIAGFVDHVLDPFGAKD